MSKKMFPGSGVYEQLTSCVGTAAEPAPRQAAYGKPYCLQSHQMMGQGDWVRKKCRIDLECILRKLLICTCLGMLHGSGLQILKEKGKGVPHMWPC